ncbi:transcriptional regulator BetI [Planctomycetes bacterium CA13]|uniref:Transcriptional regulator BetI n=1 Tax=Novipirellula herctigrandis TaxID=2527986 RepID=A0A5C5Z1Z7_9BACT|nr:transcriptional regulator BetI [Planctomycetes bacterium CA13]
MNKKPERVSKTDWLKMALDALEAEGIDGVRIERLARELGVAKSGFYWHFKDRDGLLTEMLKYWSEEFTEVVAEDPSIEESSPSVRLLSIAEMIEEQDLAKYDIAMRAWAEHDTKARRAVRRVYRRRHDFVTQLFAELGFRGQDLEMRVATFVTFHTWDRCMFAPATKAKRRATRELRIKMLVRK